MVKLLLAALLCVAAPVWAQHDHGRAKPALALSAAFDAEGRLWRAEARERHVWVSYSEDKGRSYSAPIRVNATPENIAAEGENRPKIAFAPSHRIYLSWTQSLDKPYSGNVRFSRSLDGGKTFSEPITVNDNREIISHRFDALLVDGVGRIHLTWLDKRDARDKSYVGATLYHAISEDGGQSFKANQRLAANSCECCRVVMALDRDGVPLVFWRHIFGRNVRDHALLKLDDKSTLMRVSHDQWAVDACPHHGPTLAVATDGTRHLAWYNNAPERHGLFYAHMTPDGQLAQSLAFGSFAAQASHPSVIARGALVVLAWKEFDGERSVIQDMTSSDSGKTWGAPRCIAASAGASDHPLLIADGATAYLSWNTALEGHRLWPIE